MASQGVEDKAVDYDKILDHIGQFGRFQWKIFFWLSFVSAAAGLAVVTFAFTGRSTTFSYFMLSRLSSLIDIHCQLQSI